jgi:hypothetical protein
LGEKEGNTKLTLGIYEPEDENGHTPSAEILTALTNLAAASSLDGGALEENPLPVAEGDADFVPQTMEFGEGDPAPVAAPTQMK